MVSGQRSAADSEASRCTLACEQALLIGLACVVGARKNMRALVRSFLCPQLPSACYASYIWASEAIRAKTRERAAKSPASALSRLLSGASRASAFHHIPQMESLLEG